MDAAKIDALRNNFSGEIILPTDVRYEQLRNTISAKGAPAIILRVQNNKDISIAIRFAVDNSLILSVRSGGHSVAGLSTNVDGLVLDLSALNKIEVIDKEKGLVRIGPGAQWGVVASMLQQYGLAISSGDTTTVGVGGLTLGGGIGWMVRKYGLAIDSLVAVEMITADGKTLSASETENPELFWAIRGGGGNFGVVTAFEFVAHPVRKVYAGPIIFTLDNVGELLKGWRDYMRSADESLTTIINILPSFFNNPPMFLLNCCYAGDDQTAAMKAIEPLKQLGKVVSEDIKEKNYSEVLEAAHPPEGIKIIVQSAFIEDFKDQVIQAIVEARQKKADFILQIRGLGGAMKRVAPDSTAFAYRNSEVLALSPTFLLPTATDADALEAVKPWQSIAAFGKGAYSGFMSTATEDDVSKIFPEKTYQRLSKVKQDFDPQNIFNQNYNIHP